MCDHFVSQAVGLDVSSVGPTMWKTQVILYLLSGASLASSTTEQLRVPLKHVSRFQLLYPWSYLDCSVQSGIYQWAVISICALTTLIKTVILPRTERVLPVDRCLDQLYCLKLWCFNVLTDRTALEPRGPDRPLSTLSASWSALQGGTLEIPGVLLEICKLAPPSFLSSVSYTCCHKSAPLGIV